MKHFYSQIKNFINIALFLGIFLQSYSASSQGSTLVAGDILITGYDATVTPSSSASDSYSFVLLRNITAGTVISFTDRGYTGTGWFAAGPTEGAVTWTSSGALVMGTEILIKGLTASLYDSATSSLVANGTVVRTEGTFLYGLSLSSVGDQIIAFQGGGGSITGTSPAVNIITGLSYAQCDAVTSTAANWDSTTSCTIGPSTSVKPPGLGANGFYLGVNPVSQSSKFIGTGPFADAAAIKTAVLNSANWQSSTTALTMPSGAPFVGIPPTFTTNPTDKTICVGGGTSFTIAADDADTYQWQVDTGVGGFTNITNNAIYSNVTSTVLTISGATAAMNGYLYRCTATGISAVNSTAGKLNISNISIVTTTQNNVSCKGGTNGSATVSASGGIAPYTYSWSPSGITTDTAGGLAAGTYTVTVTDGILCSKTHSVIITEPLVALSAISSTTPASCFGGSNGTATVTATGGTSGYSYVWSNGVSTATAFGLSTGVYSVTVTDSKSCTFAVSNIVVGQPTAPVDGTASTTPVSCFGGTNGTAAIAATGGNPGYTYLWSNGDTTAIVSGLSAGIYSVAVTDSKSCTKTIENIVVGGPVAPLDGIGSSTPVSCFGGSNGTAKIIASGGNSGYNYVWSNGATTSQISGLTAGTYSVTITDSKSCSKFIDNIVVGQPAVLASNLVTTPVLCNGGSSGTASASPSGGTGSYSYLWSTGATTASISNLAQGNYNVTITDDNSCPKIENFTITEPSVLVAAQGTVSNVSCNGGSNGSAAVVPSGGGGGYTYSWSPVGGSAATASGLTAGTYIVTVTDANSCTATQSFTLTEPSVLTANAAAHINVSCNGGTNGSATVNAAGGAGGYTYSWSPVGGNLATASGLAAGTYTVTVTDANSCTTTQAFTIKEPAQLTASQASITNIGCRGDATGAATVSAAGGTGGYTYSWSPVGGNAATASGLAAGTYVVTVTDDNSCQTTQSFSISEPAAILSAVTASTSVSCFGGSNGTASVTVSGGTSGYTYLWAPFGGTGPSISGRPAGNYTCTITDANGCTLVENITINSPAAFSAAVSKTDVSCNGGANGSAAITPSGATAPYTYTWSPSGGNGNSASGLTAGTYSVFIQDANTCVYTVNVTIDESAPLTVTPSQTDVLCNGGASGTAAVTANGGTPGYTYAWSPSGGNGAAAIGLTSGNYSCLVTDSNGCSFTQNFNITEPAILSAAITKIDATCITAGQATVSVSGGTTPYTYAWSPSGAITATATGLTAGSHTCLITDGNGCTIVKNVTINTTNTLIASTSKTDVLCNGTNTGSASVVPSGAPGPFTYVWSPSGGNAATASNLSVGNYSVTITSANGCSIVKNITLTEPVLLTVSAGSQTNVSCNGGSNGSAAVNTTGGTGAYTYLWLPSGGTGSTASGLSAGTYTATVTDDNNCTATQSFIITEPAVLTASSGSQTTVSCNGGSNGSATVNAAGGTGVYTYLWFPSGGTGSTASGLSAGTYTATVTDANSCTATQSFTITEPAVLTTSAAGQNNISCNGESNGSATVSVIGGTGVYTYTWFPSGGTGSTASGLSAGTYTVTVTDENSCTTTQSFTLSEPAALIASAAGQTNVSCNGGSNGSATVSVIGGTGTYLYAWSPSGGTGSTASGLSAGTYTVTVTDDNSCTTTQSFTLTEPDALIASAAGQTNISCNGGSNGSATVSVIGGTGTYLYAWSPSGGTGSTASGLSAGTYTATVTDDNNCTASQSFIITEPAVLTAAVAQTNVLCNGGSTGTATVNAAGGTGTYTYLWSPAGGTGSTASGLSAGTYTVTVTDDNSCTTMESFDITEPAVLTASAAGQNNISCNGGSNGSVTVSVIGGTGTYSYAWSPSGGTGSTASGLSAGTYVVTVTDDNSCTATQSFILTEPALLTASAAGQTNISCNGGSNGSAAVNAAGGTGTYSYAWSPSGGTGSTASGLSAGTYTVTVTDGNSCTATQSFILTEPDALTASSAGQTNISCNGGSNGSATVSVLGGTGTYSYIWSPLGGTGSTASGLSAGTYTVTVTDANSCTTTQSFIITEPAVLTAVVAQTNVLCNGGNNGSATVNAAGGTGTYSYTWFPSGGTGSTASGLSAGTYTVTVTDANSCTATQSVIITEPAVLTASAAGQNNISCNGGSNGSATVSVIGGTGTYLYTWSPSGGTGSTASGLSAGTYTVTVTDDNSCTTTQSFTLSEPAALIASAAGQTNVSCNGGSNGSATVSVIGGTGTYSYAWSPSGGTGSTASGLIAGTYTATVTDANSCVTTQSFTITEPDVLIASIAAQTNISCSGLSDGAATINAAGGVTPYSYVWSDGSTTKDITGVIAGTYTLTVTDANNCAATQTVVIITIPDTTAPVPNLAVLPVITNYCAVLSSQIAIPTATDNCSGVVTAATSDALTYNTPGSYNITWTYTDASGNTASQTQTIEVLNSPLEQVTLSDASFTYDSNPHTIQVSNLPLGAAVNYSIVPAAGSGSTATNAGIYTINAIVSPSLSSANCGSVVLTAVLTINKASQEITFNPIPVKFAENGSSFQLDAISNSGLPVNYTSTSVTQPAPASISTGGLVNILKSGQMTITAHQDGDDNYLPAPEISQSLIIKSRDAVIQNITIGTQSFDNPLKEIKYVIECGETSLNIKVTTENSEIVLPSKNFTLQFPKAGIYQQNIVVTSEDESTSAVYSLTLEKRFDFDEIVVKKFNNVLLVNNNPLTNGGYEFIGYEWYKNGEVIGTGQYYSAGNTAGATLDPTAAYMVKLTTKDGKVLQTCTSHITLLASSEARLYPNPIEEGKAITIEADFSTAELENMQISVYSLSGSLIKTVHSSTAKTEVQLPPTSSNSMYLVVLETPNIKKSFKVVVKK